MIAEAQDWGKRNKKVDPVLIVSLIFDQGIEKLRGPLGVSDIREAGNSGGLKYHVDLSWQVVLAKLLEIIGVVLPSVCMRVMLDMFLGVPVATIITEPNVVPQSGECKSRSHITIVGNPLVSR